MRLAAVLALNQARAFGIHRQGALTLMDWPDFGEGRLERAKLCLKTMMSSLIATPLA